MYRLICKDRHYNDFVFIQPESHDIYETTIFENPYENKLLHNDIVDKEGNIKYSTTRSAPYIPGVIKVDKKFGKVKDKYYYHFVPDDKRLPYFMILYKDKQEYHFQKDKSSIFAIVRFKHWKKKHPECEMIQCIGPVHKNENVYEYLLYCKYLYSSIKTLHDHTKKSIKHRSVDYMVDDIMNTYTIEDRRHPKYKIYTIDPEESKDFDDAYGIRKINEGKQTIISIYISNVTVWLDYLDLWSSFSKRVSTIYLPDRRIPMLPTILSEDLCSLVEKQARFALALDITIDTESGEIIHEEFKNVCIKVKKNIRYDDTNYKENTHYKTMFHYITLWNNTTKYLKDIQDSHDLIAYIMILYNNRMARILKKNKVGIFKKMKLNPLDLDALKSNIDEKLYRFLCMWNSTASTYVFYKDFDTHDLIPTDAYAHVSSPIRRLVDLLNMLYFEIYIEKWKYQHPIQLHAFMDEWLKDTSLEYINDCMHKIKKIQTECTLLSLLHTRNASVIEKGYCIEYNEEQKNYTVYIPSLKVIKKMKCRESIPLYQKRTFHIYLFEKKDIRQKVKIELHSSQI